MASLVMRCLFIFFVIRTHDRAGRRAPNPPPPWLAKDYAPLSKDHTKLSRDRPQYVQNF